MSDLYFGVCRDKLTGEIVSVGVSSNAAAAVRRVMVTVASFPEVQAFGDDYEYSVEHHVIDTPMMSAEEFGKLMEDKHA